MWYTLLSEKFVQGKFPAVKELGDDGTVLLELFQRLLGKQHINTQHSGCRSQKLFHRQAGVPVFDTPEAFYREHAADLALALMLSEEL